MIGVITRSKSCSGTCLNFSTARQPKTSALESAEGAGGRGTARARCRSDVAHAALLRFAASLPVSAKNTSSRLGLPIEKSASSMPAAISAASASFARLRRAGHDRQLGAFDAALDAGAEMRFEQPRGFVEPRRIGERHVQEARSRSRPSARGCVPSAIFLPWSMTAMRAASWSASSRYCVVSRMVTPELGELADHAPHALARHSDRGRSSARRGRARPA